MDDTGSISPPLIAPWTVVNVTEPDGITGLLLASLNVPEKLNSDGPFPSLPSVMIYVTVITELLSNFLPKIPSPNNSSYFSSWTSWSR